VAGTKKNLDEIITQMAADLGTGTGGGGGGGSGSRVNRDAAITEVENLLNAIVAK